MSPEAHCTTRAIIEAAALVAVVLAIGSCMSRPFRTDAPQIECIKARGNWRGPLDGCKFEVTP